mgnify:CR=1 FL=1
MLDTENMQTYLFEAEDVTQLKSHTRIVENVNYCELVVHEKCEQITNKWYLLQPQKSEDIQ